VLLLLAFVLLALLPSVMLSGSAMWLCPGPSGLVPRWTGSGAVSGAEGIARSLGSASSAMGSKAGRLGS
jgi:hypothetical protein